MSPFLLIVIQSIVLPFGLSGLLLWPGSHKDMNRVIGNALIWLAAYAWIIQWPAFPPREAVDWLWLLLVASVVAGYITHRRARWLFRTTIFLTAIVAIAWPVLHYQPSVALAGELVIMVVTGSVLFCRAEHISPSAPVPALALALAIQATGLAIASALSGSLLVGQLSAALAAVTGACAILEILGRPHKTPFRIQQRLAFLPLYLGLLTIARLYAELPPATTALLFASAVFSVFTPWRHGWAISLLLNAGAIGLMILNSDNTAYY